MGTAGAPSVPLPLCPGRIGARLKGFRNRRSENTLLLQGGDPGAVCAPQLCQAVPLPSCCGPTSELSAFGSSSACSPTGPRSFASGRQRTAPLSPGPTVLCWPGPALQLTSLTAASPRAETSGPGHELPGSAAGPKVPHRGRRLSQCGRSFGVTAAGGHCMDCGQVRVLRGCRGAALCCAVLCCAVLCCTVLCCAVLYCAVLYCAVLCCTVLCCAVPSRRSPRSPCRRLRRCPANHCLTLPHVPIDVFIAMGGNCRPRST